MFFALHASFTSLKSFANIEIIDSDIHTNTFISSVFILNIFSGVHNNLIVSAIPSNCVCA